jgi:hypothetical protein
MGLRHLTEALATSLQGIVANIWIRDEKFSGLARDDVGPAGAGVWQRWGARRLGRSSDRFKPGFCAKLMLKDLRLSQSVRATRES